ncbi:hypothetical protein XMV225_000822 [Aliiroseovarius sp. xm-v-225]|nr:hypothetical protein [Aliiroseovarius sp. xm-m-378]NRP64537.1 hypothetical protein [Aliiroseovarius sp. xm-v-225]NRP92298.1 hypothetical protein [Aliiroseovarius sp. xm-a-134]
MISLGDVGPVYFTSDDLRRFGKDLISIAALGGVTNMDSEFKIGTSGLQVRRRGNGLMFYEYENLNSEPKATFPNRHVDKLVHSFELAIRSQDEKLKSYYAQ